MKVGRVNMDGRVLVISNMYPAEEYPSFGIFVKNQVDQLKKRNWSTKVIAITDPRSDKPRVLKKYLFWMIKAFFYILFKGRQYDVVHIHYVFPSGLFGLLAKSLWKKRFVVTVHGGDIDKMAKKNEMIFRWTKKILKEADHVISVGKGLYSNLVQEFHVEAEKISIISMGVNQSIFTPQDKQTVKEQLNVSHQKVILFVGNIIKEKGILELLEAFKTVNENYPDAYLHIIGTYKQSQFYEEVQNKIKKLDLEEKIVFHGVLRPRKVAKWMNASEMLVLPSWMEGFGLVALEAMSCGTPVVGSDVGGLSHLLDDDCGIKVPVRDIDNLANAIEYILDGNDRVKQIVKNGLDRSQEHNSDEVLNKVIAIYKGENRHE